MQRENKQYQKLAEKLIKINEMIVNNVFRLILQFLICQEKKKKNLDLDDRYVPH